MVGNEGFVGNVLIPISRYEELLACESRLQVLMDLLKQEETLSTPEICTICGYPKEGQKLKEKADARLAEYLSKEVMKDEN